MKIKNKNWKKIAKKYKKQSKRLKNEIEILKVSNTKLYEEKQESVAAINKVKDVLGVEGISLNSFEHNNLFEIIFQVQAFKEDLETFEKLSKTRKESVGHWMKVFERNYPRAKKYIDSFENRDERIGALKSKY